MRYSWKNFNIEDAKNFISLNNIKNKKELKTKFIGLYTLCKKSGWINKLTFQQSNINWGKFDSVMKVQDFILENNISSRGQLKLNFSGLYWKSVNNKWINLLKFKNDCNNYSNIETAEDAQKFILDNNIKSYTDRENRFPGFSSKCDKHKWNLELSYCEPPKTTNWNFIDSINKAQEFIKSEGLTRSEFSTEYPGLIDKFYKKSWMKDLVFLNKKYKSSWETKMKLILENNNISDKITILENSKFSYSNHSELDLFIPEYKIAVEIQGPTHFWEIYGKQSFSFTRKSDLKKNRWCRENGIKLYYFSYGDEYVKYGYPYYIYTSEKELLNDILLEINKQSIDK